MHLTYKLSMAVCNRCDLTQLYDHIPETELINPPTWIRYNEPELHLDSVVSELVEFIGDTSARIRGLSYKDQSTINRLERLGYKDSEVYDFGLTGTGENPINIERLQKVITLKNCCAMKSAKGEADVLLVRHVLEHTFNTSAFLLGIKALVSDNATIIFEVPDCLKQIKHYDYTCLWEEHTIYFVKNTFESLLKFNGFKVERSFLYEFATENSLVAICTVGEAHNEKVHSESLTNTHEYRNNLLNFRNRFDNIRRNVHNNILEKNKWGQVVIFGAGHLAITFIHLFGLTNLISFVIDDDPNKCGKLIPGTNIEIRSSKSLITEKIDTCLLSLSPESEKRLLDMKKDSFKNIRNINSIFPGKNSVLRSQGNET